MKKFVLLLLCSLIIDVCFGQNGHTGNISWAEIWKLAGSGLLGALVGYFLNKRLQKKHQAIELGGTFSKSLIKGFHEIMRDYRGLVDKSEEIKQQLLSNNLSSETIKTFGERVREYEDKFSAHRIYLTPIIPYGGSSYVGQHLRYDDIKITAAKFLLYLLCNPVENKEQYEAYRDNCLTAINGVMEGYKSMTEKGNKIIKHIKKDKDPLSIDW